MFASSVSLDPLLVAFFPGRLSSSWRRTRATGRFCVNVLGDRQQALSRRFATSAEDKFAGIAHRISDMGLPILDDVVAWIDCELYAVHEAGDHDIALGRVAALAAELATRPLLFHKGGYGQLHPIPQAA